MRGHWNANRKTISKTWLAILVRKLHISLYTFLYSKDGFLIKWIRHAGIEWKSRFTYLDMQLTLPIHVNPLTAINTSHHLSPGAWHMIPIIGHQRRLTAANLSKLTCDFRKLPPEHNIYPNILFPRMSSYCQTWLISLTFVLYAVKKHCETRIRFFVSVVREKYIEIVLLCHMMNFYSYKIAQLGSASCAMKTFFPSIT